MTSIPGDRRVPDESTARHLGGDGRIGIAMLREAVLVVVALSMWACSSRESPPPADPYAGRPVSDLALRFGPPMIAVDVGNDQRAFHWVQYDQRWSLPPAGATLVDALRVPQRECRYLWAVAHTLRPPGPGLGNWIVDDWQYTGAGC